MTFSSVVGSGIIILVVTGLVGFLIGALCFDRTSKEDLPVKIAMLSGCVTMSICLSLFVFFTMQEWNSVIEFACDYSNVYEALAEQEELFSDRSNRLDELYNLHFVMDTVCGSAQ